MICFRRMYEIDHFVGEGVEYNVGRRVLCSVLKRRKRSQENPRWWSAMDFVD